MLAHRQKTEYEQKNQMILQWYEFGKENLARELNLFGTRLCSSFYSLYFAAVKLDYLRLYLQGFAELSRLRWCHFFRCQLPEVRISPWRECPKGSRR